MLQRGSRGGCKNNARVITNASGSSAQQAQRAECMDGKDTAPARKRGVQAMAASSGARDHRRTNPTVNPHAHRGGHRALEAIPGRMRLQRGAVDSGFAQARPRAPRGAGQSGPTSWFADFVCQEVRRLIAAPAIGAHGEGPPLKLVPAARALRSVKSTARGRMLQMLSGAHSKSERCMGSSVPEGRVARHVAAGASRTPTLSLSCEQSGRLARVSHRGSAREGAGTRSRELGDSS